MIIRYVAICSTKESKQREFGQRICDKESLYNFFGEKMKILTTKGDGKGF